MKINDDNITIEFKKLTNYITNSQEELENLSNYFNEIINQGNNFYNNVLNSINNFFTEDKLLEANSKIGQTLNFFYQSNIIFLNNLKNILKNYKQKLIIPLEEQKIQLNEANNSFINEYNKIINKVKNSKNKVLKCQKDYYISYVNYSNYKKLMNEEINNSNVQINKDYFIKLKAECDNYKKIYEYQIKTHNINLIEYDKNYFELYSNLKVNEEVRLNFYKKSFDNYFIFIEDVNKKLIEFNEHINSKLKIYNIKDDLNLFSENLNFSKKNSSRFSIEEFIPFSNNNMNNLENLFNLYSNQNKNLNWGSFFGFGQLGNNNLDEEEKYSNLNEEKTQKKIIKDFVKYLESENELLNELISIINYLLNNDKDFCILFIKTYINSHKHIYTEIKNYNNLIHFSNILNNILLNNILDKENINNLSLGIIYISQRIYSHYPNDNKIKIFLSALMGKKYLFQSNSFWNEIILFKMKLKFRNNIKQIENKYNEYNKKITENQNNNSYTGYLTNFFYNKGTENINKSNLNKNKLSQFANHANYLNYENLPLNIAKNFDNLCLIEFNSIIKEIIPWFINFNFGYNNGIDFIINLCNKFNIDSNLINYYMTYFNTSKYSIKQFNSNLIIDLNVKEKIEKINLNKKERKDSSINNNNFISLKDKFIILQNCLIFLDNKNKLNLLFINKELNKILKNKIYKIILRNLPFYDKEKNLIIKENLEKRKKIWETILKIPYLKKQYKYTDYLNKLKDINYDKKSSNDFNTIDLDCARTYFNEKSEEKRKIINNILKVSILTFSNLNYCQGMNFIISFFINLFNDEEESYYLYLGLLNSTDLKIIFEKDLLNLKIYFTIFERILILYMPIIFLYLKNNNILTNYYASPWFITLFTSTMNTHNKLNILVKIFDNFILNGWKTIFNTSLMIVKEKEDYILSLKNEELLKYFNGEIVEQIFYNEDNYKFEELINKSCLIKEKLIKNIEKEIGFENQIQMEFNENINKINNNEDSEKNNNYTFNI